MWILFGILSALSDATKNVFAKQSTKSFDALVITWAWTAFSLFILVPIMFFKAIPTLDGTFWAAFSVRIILDAIALVLYVNAVKRTDLSLSLPMLALTPVFILFTGLIINHQFPAAPGIAGVTAITLGAYLLNFKRGGRLLQPFLTIYQDKGVFMMLGVAVIWSFTAPLHKVAISHSNPYFYSGLGAVALAVIFAPIAWWSNKQDFKKVLMPRNIPKIAPIGIFYGLDVLMQMIAQSLTLAVFALALKRTSIVFSSIMGWLFFKEPIKKRIAPICLMVSGVILIALS